LDAVFVRIKVLITMYLCIILINNYHYTKLRLFKLKLKNGLMTFNVNSFQEFFKLMYDDDTNRKQYK